MYIPIWTLILLAILLFYLIHKINKHSENIHGLQYDLNNLEVQVGVLEGEDWAINSDENKKREQDKKQKYYDGETGNGDYDALLGVDRRKRDGKNPKLGTHVE